MTAPIGEEHEHFRAVKGFLTSRLDGDESVLCKTSEIASHTALSVSEAAMAVRRISEGHDDDLAAERWGGDASPWVFSRRE